MIRWVFYYTGKEESPVCVDVKEEQVDQTIREIIKSGFKGSLNLSSCGKADFFLNLEHVKLAARECIEEPVAEDEPVA